MQLPPDLFDVSVNITPTPANTTVNTSMVAAPGAGFRFRVWALTVACSDTSQAPANLRYGLREDAAGTVHAFMSSSGFAGKEFWYPGGVRWAANTALYGFARSSVADILLAFHAYYTVELA